MSFSVASTNTGFMWGPAIVTRLFDDPKHGVWMEIAGAKERIEVRVTRGGRLRVGKREKTTIQNTTILPPVIG